MHACQSSVGKTQGLLDATNFPGALHMSHMAELYTNPSRWAFLIVRFLGNVAQLSVTYVCSLFLEVKFFPTRESSKTFLLEFLSGIAVNWHGFGLLHGLDHDQLSELDGEKSSSWSSAAREDSAQQHQCTCESQRNPSSGRALRELQDDASGHIGGKNRSQQYARCHPRQRQTDGRQFQTTLRLCHARRHALPSPHSAGNSSLQCQITPC